MSSFEDFARRSKLDLEAYFTANNITSDEGLRAYCELNKIGLPTLEYFKQENLEEKKPAEKPKNIPKPKAKKVNKTPEKNEEKAAPAPKKTRSTRSRTRKAPAKK
tara:strand:+ start:2119 stop:2433 length:315 start_codon:yes stop_codon:yes gene_type:complete